MTERICFGIVNNPSTSKNAGQKAPTDAIHIATQNCGYSLLPFSFPGSEFKIGVIRPLLEAKVMAAIRKINGSIILINYPFTLVSLIHSGYASLCKRNKVILLIHDIDFLRGKDCDHQLTLTQLNQASCLIVHNQRQMDYLRHSGVDTQMVSLELFDYLLPPPKTNPTLHKHFTNSVAFIGNLTKSPFILQWIGQNRTYSIEIIGACDSDSLKAQIAGSGCYKGSFLPEEVPYKVESSFGLIWDGASVDSCSGGSDTYKESGEYLKYNNPHKTSLYIACGIPIIIWSQAAMADFVLRNGIGFVIDSLSDMESVLKSMTEEGYQKMLANIRPIRERVTKGKYLEDALKKAESLI